MFYCWNTTIGHEKVVVELEHHIGEYELIAGTPHYTIAGTPITLNYHIGIRVH